jgi:PAS domain S-box-containing protein
MLLDSELRLLDANPVARKLLRGLLDEPADALVMLTKALVPRDGEVESCEALAARLARGVASPGELFELVSEPRRLLRITSLPICDSSGRVGSVLLRARDETELAEATARARERAALLEAVFDAAGFAVAVVDRAGRLRFANAATERLWGSSLADSLGESAQELLERATEVDPQGLARVRELFAARDAAARRVDLSLRDGRVVEVACVPMSEEGVVTQRLYLAADVTEQRHHETSAREAARLADLSQLAGGVAHGFNNLLSAVLGNVELIELTDPGNPRIRQFLREMRATVQRGAELSNQLLAYAGRAPLRRARIDMAELIEREAAELERQLPSVSLQRRIAQPLAPVFGDASQLAHVLGSLLRNAADALHPRGSAIAIEARDDAGRVEVRVKDDGAGMDEATLARAFDPFFSTKPKASGLSLSAARGIVSQHGGSLTAESALGQGSTFTLRLPRASEADFSAEPRASSTRSWRGSGRILVVDDEAPTLSVTRALAEALGFEAIAADRPSAALAAWRSVGGAVRVALIDAMMPECDGTELLRQLRLESPGLPAVIYSGFARESFELPAQPPTVFLQKPLSLQALSDALRRVLHEDVVSPAPGSAEASRPSRA